MEKLTVKDDGERLDKYLSTNLDISRSKIKKLIDNKKVLVNDEVVPSKYLVKENDVITVDDNLDFTIWIKPEKKDLDIVYEDKYLMIINKPSGMVTHPAPGHYEKTLVNYVMYHLNMKETNNLRPGIVHRLDKDTSGLMVVAKDEKTLELLSEMIKERKVKRHYLAIVRGIIKEDSATIDAPIGRDKKNREKMAVTDENSKDAITHIKVLKRFKKSTLIECVLETGRTHQIRVHLNYIGHPLLNDPLYGIGEATSVGQMLHSKSIEFIHPITKEKIYFEKEPPIEFKECLQKLENE